MARIAFDAQHFGYYLKPFTIFTMHFKANGAANLR